MLNLTGCKEEKYANETEHLCALLEKDKPNNQKSVYWDGEKAELIKDELDDKNLSDGRYGEYSVAVTEVEGVYRFRYYKECLKDAQVVSDKSEDYCIVAEDREVRIEQVDYEAEKKAFKENERYKEYKDDRAEKRLKNYKENYKLYVGTEELEEHLPYAGYVLLFQSDETKSAYKISVSGEGYMEDIWILAGEIMRSFEEITEE